MKKRILPFIVAMAVVLPIQSFAAENVEASAKETKEGKWNIVWQSSDTVFKYKIIKYQPVKFSKFPGGYFSYKGKLVITTAKPKVEQKVQPKPAVDVTPEIKEDAKPVVETKPEIKEEPKPEPAVETKPEIKEESKPEPVVETKPEIKEEPKPKPAVETKPEIKQEPNPKPIVEAKPVNPTEPKQEATPTVPKQEVTPTVTTQKDTETSADTSISQVEQEVVRLVNIERSKQGLQPLIMDSALQKVAKAKSEDMKAKNYFSHTSPTYGSPFDMMRTFGISYKAAGENIAKGQRSAQEVVNSWMNSAGHRANIMSTSYTHIGVGYVESGHYWTQMFIKK